MRTIKLFGDEYQCYGGGMKLDLSAKKNFMNYLIMPGEDIATQRIGRRRITPHYRFPSISIFMPFDPKMGMKNKLTFSLSKATDKVVNELNTKYPGEMSMLVIQKLKAIIKNLDFNTHKKSVAIFISPVFEKTYYLNIEVEEKVIVKESLQIRDIVYSKKQSQEFHILSLSEKGSRIFLSETNSSVKITPDNIFFKNICQNVSSERPENFSDAVTKEEIVMDEFLHHVDHSLDIILKHHMLPVFVMGTEKIVGRFKNITKSNKAVIEYVHGDYEKSALEDLKEVLKPQIADWQKIKEKNLLDQLKEAANKNKLSFGLEDVRSEMINRRGRLLLMEKIYLWENNELNYRTSETYNKFSCIRNPIDEMIEKVLENGGDVELVSNGALKEYSQIALIKD